MLITEKQNKLNIDFNKDNAPDISTWKDIYGSHLKVGNKVYGDFPQIDKVTDYLYEITIDEYDEDYAQETLSNIFGACSEVRNGNIIGRNYDWYYSNNVEFVVRVPAKGSRHESIGVSSVNVTQAEMTAEQYNEKLKLIPYETLDGVNDCGVYCGTNVVPVGDKGYTTGTNKKGKDLPNISIVRFVLDNATSAKHAIQLLKDRNIYAVKYDNQLIELHCLIADAEDTFIVEFVNNEMVVLPYTNKKAIMTNFYQSDWNGQIKAKWLGDTDDGIRATGLTDHAEGLERYLILQDKIDDITSIDSAKTVMKDVLFTKAYDLDTDPFWYSELTGARNLTIYNTALEYAPVVTAFIEMYQNRDRNNPVTWQTVHSSAYDIANRILKVSVQEADTVYMYSLGGGTR